MIKIYSVTKDFANTRLDKWYKKNICHIPQSLFEKTIRRGKIKVNNKKQSSGYKLQLNDKIAIVNFNPSSNKKLKSNFNYKPSKKEVVATSNFIIENNENFIVINKPAGISVQSGTKSKRNILDILKKTKYFDSSYPLTVHRIDKDTTGVLIVAKNRNFAKLFTYLFRVRRIHKTYLGIVLGTFEKLKGTYKDNLIYYEDYKEISKNAITHYEVLDSRNNYSLLKINLETGRKHQIRRQLLLHNHPILGDNKYKFYENLKSKKNTLMLHAYSINFSIDGKKYKFLAEPPDSFKKTLKEKNLKISQ